MPAHEESAQDQQHNAGFYDCILNRGIFSKGRNWMLGVAEKLIERKTEVAALNVFVVPQTCFSRYFRK